MVKEVYKMKKTIKNVWLLILSLALTVCAGISLISLKGAVYASGERVFAMTDGAYIRTDEPQGIRFEANFNETVYNELFSEGKRANGKTLGMMIVPLSYVEECEVSEEYKGDYYRYCGEIKQKMLDCVYSADRIARTENGYRIRAAITKMLFENSAREFIGIAYIKTEAENGISYEYAAFEKSYARSVAAVARVALNKNVDTEYAAMLRNCIDKAYYVNSGVSYDETAEKYSYNGTAYDSLETIPIETPALDAYYDGLIPIGNSGERAFFFSLSGGPVYGNNNIKTAKAESEIGGRNDAYSYVQSGAGVVRIVGITNDYFTTNDYKKLSMKLYFTGGFSANDLFFKVYNKYATIEIRLNAANLGGGQGMKFFCMKDADGNVITDITEDLKNTWITFEVKIDGIANNANAAGLNLEISVNANNYDKPLYLADVKFDKYPAIAIDGAEGAELRSVNKATYYDSDTLKIENAGSYQGKTDVYKITETSSIKRGQGLSIYGVTPAELAAKGLSKLSFDIYYTGVPSVTVFGYSSDNFIGSTVFAATMSIDKTSYITYKDSKGNPATNINAGAWYTVEIDVSSLADGPTIKEKDVTLIIFNELNTEYFIANARFV